MTSSIQSVPSRPPSPPQPPLDSYYASAPGGGALHNHYQQHEVTIEGSSCGNNCDSSLDPLVSGSNGGCEAVSAGCGGPVPAGGGVVLDPAEMASMQVLVDGNQIRVEETVTVSPSSGGHPPMSTR